MEDLFNDALVDEFVIESREHLDAIEPDLLELEEKGTEVSPELVNRVFRAIHSVKGGAGFLAYESLKKLSHAMESVLMKVREGELAVTPAISDVLLRSVDKLRAMVEDIQNSESIECALELNELATFLDEDAPTGEPEPQKTAAQSTLPDGLRDRYDLRDAVVTKACTYSTPLYEVTVCPVAIAGTSADGHGEFVRNVESMGTVLLPSKLKSAHGSLDQCLRAGEEFSFLYLTVLEPDLAGVALELEPDQVIHIPTDLLNAHLSQEPADSLGKILVDSGDCDSKGVAGGLQKQLEGDTRQLGDILVADGAASDATIETAIKTQDQQRAIKGQQAKKQNGGETLRVRVDLLSSLMNTAGELVLARNQLLRTYSASQYSDGGTLMPILQNIDRITTEIQDKVMHTRLQPIGTVFGKFPRVVRDIARALNKEIRLDVVGSEVELDKSIIELLSDPLTHIVRNCADHAIEAPDDRERQGKPREGTVVLRAYHEGGQVNILIEDDGKGIDPEVIGKSALAKGVVTRAQLDKMSRREITELVFAPGFSTAEQVSELSGRGVGMDVVRTNVEKLGGTVSIDSHVNKGTKVLLELPLTLAIIPSLMVGAEQNQFAIPQVAVEELVWVRAADVGKKIERIQGEDVLRLRGHLLSLVRLTDVLGMSRSYGGHADDSPQPDRRERIADRRGENNSEDAETEKRTADRRQDWHGDYNIVVLRSGKDKFGLIVSELFDTEEIVVKPLSMYLKSNKAFSGATITGEGRVITILDVGGIVSLSGLRFATAEETQNADAEEAQATVEQTLSIVLCEGAPSEIFAIPQQSILRLEKIDPSDIQKIGDSEFITFRGKGLPIVRLDKMFPIGQLAPAAEHLFLIVPKVYDDTGFPLAGVLVSKILDATDVPASLQRATLTGAGVMGTLVINDNLTTFFDVSAIAEAAMGQNGDTT